MRHFISEWENVVFHRDKRQRYFAMILPAYLDDSADKHRERLFATGGVLCKPLEWFDVECKWEKELKNHGINYFRTSDCKWLDGGFRKYRSLTDYPKPQGRQKADEIRANLETIISKSHVLGFGLAIHMKDFHNFIASEPNARIIFPTDDPYVMGFYSLMFQIVYQVMTHSKDNKDNIVAFVCDEEETHEAELTEAYRQLKLNHPELEECIGSLTFMDDKKCAPLQVADLMAGVTKDYYEQWLANDEVAGPLPIMLQNNIDYLAMFNEKHMQTMLEKNLKR
jgi:hypothetical protein